MDRDPFAPLLLLQKSSLFFFNIFAKKKKNIFYKLSVKKFLLSLKNVSHLFIFLSFLITNLFSDFSSFLEIPFFFLPSNSITHKLHSPKNNGKFKFKKLLTSPYVNIVEKNSFCKKIDFFRHFQILSHYCTYF